MTFGQQLKAWRDVARLTQTELARAAKVSVPYISNLERDFSANTRSGKPRASVLVCERLAAALGVPSEEVMIAAGHAPIGYKPAAKPQNLVEFIQALERLGLDFGTLLGQIEIIEKYTPDEFQDLIERIQADVRIDVEQKMRRLLK